MSDRAVMFPADVRQAHARVIAAIKYEEDKALQKRFTEMAQRLEPLAWEHDGLVIAPAESESQLIAEGKTLRHGVSGYGKDHCAGNSIFFIRRAEDVEMPYFTLQLNTRTGTVLQNRGMQNCDRTKAVAAFEEEWLTTVVMPWVKKNKRKEAKTA